jgi:hypothetical protein
MSLYAFIGGTIEGSGSNDFRAYVPESMVKTLKADPNVESLGECPANVDAMRRSIEFDWISPLNVGCSTWDVSLTLRM